MEQRTHQLGVFVAQAELFGFDQVLGDMLVEIVDDVLTVLELVRFQRFGRKVVLHAEAVVGKHQTAHALHLAEKLLHSNRRGEEEQGIEILEAHGFLNRILAAHQQAGQLFEHFGKRQKHQRAAHVEGDMAVGDLQAQVIAGQSADPLREGEDQRDRHKHHRAQHVEQKVHHGCALGGAGSAGAGKHRRYTGADVLAEKDEQRSLQRDGAGTGQRLQDTDAGGRGLQHRRYHQAHQHAHKRIGGGSHHVAEGSPVAQGAHGLGHGVHAHKQDAKAHGDLAKRFQLRPVAQQQTHRAHRRKDHAKVHFHRQHQGRDRGTDIGAHDNADGAPKLQKSGVYKAHHHDRGGAGGLDDARHQRAHQHSHQLVAREGFQQLFHLGAGSLLQAVAHCLDTKQE